MCSTDGKIYRSTNDVTFTNVLSNINSPLNSSGINSNGDIVCFGEYHNNTGSPVRIYNSTDGGATWSIAINLGNSATGTNIRHLHTCQYIGTQNMWIATTGDGLCNWYQSYDGSTWTLMFTSTSQYRRTLGIISRINGEFIYSSDGGVGYGGVFKTARYSGTGEVNETDITRLLTTSSSYGLDATPEVIVTCTMSAVSSPSKSAHIYISLDGGNNWVLDKTYEVSTSNYGGFTDLVGHDDKGNFYFKLADSVGLPANIGIKAKHNIDGTKSTIKEVGTYIAGTRKKIVTRSFTVTNAVKNINNAIPFLPAVGCVETILSVGAVIPAVAGAGSGTHTLQLTWGAGGYSGRVFEISAAYNSEMLIAPYGIGGSTTFLSGTFAYLRAMLDGKTLQLSKETPFYLYYNNKSDVDRADTITINIVTLQEYVMPTT